MKKFTGCFLIACLMVVNLLVVPLPTAQAVTVGNLQMNPSHNWLGGNNFVQDADLSVIINDGTPIAVRTDGNGNFNLNLWEESIRLNYGDLIVIEDSNGFVKSATVHKISANINFTSRTVSGRTIPNAPVHVDIFKNGPHPKNPYLPGGKDTTSNGSGDYSVLFSEIPLTEKYEFQVQVTDNNDQTYLWTGSPALQVNVSHNWINGRYFPANKEVTLSLSDGSNDKGQVNLTTNNFGEFNQNWNGQPENQLASGDVLTASFAGNTKTLNFDSVSADIDCDNDRVTGTGPANTQMQVTINRWDLPWEQNNRNITSISAGNFAADFTLDNEQYDPLDITPKDEAGVNYYESSSLDEVQYWFGQPRMRANISHNWVEASYLPAGTEVNLTVQAGEDVKIGPISLQTDANGNLHQDLWEYNSNIESGDVVKLDYYEENNPDLQHLEMAVQDIRAALDEANDVIEVNAPELSSLEAEIMGNWEATRRYDLNQGEFSHVFNFGVPSDGSEVTDDIDFRDEIWVRSTPPESLNQTIIVAGTPKLRAHLSYNNVQGVNLPRNAEVTLDINGELSYADTTNSQGEAWFDWEEFDNDNYRLKPGDSLVLTCEQTTIDMVVSNLTASMDVDADTVSGNATKGSSVRVERFGHEWEPSGHREINNIFDGTYKADFKIDNEEYDAYNIVASDEFGVTETENQAGNQTMINASSPKIDANVTHNYLDMRYLPPETELVIKVNGGDKGEQNFTSGSDGNYSDSWNYWEGERERFTFGDNIEVRRQDNNELVGDMTVQNISGSINHNTDTVNGKTSPNTNVSVWIDDKDWEDVYREVTSDGLGNYGVDYKPDYDVTPFDIARSSIRDMEGNQSIVVYGTPKFDIGFLDGEIFGSYFPPNTQINLSSNDGANGSTSILSNEGGEFWLNWGQEPVEKVLNIGDSLMASYIYNGQSKSVTANVLTLTGEVDVLMDRVSGTAEPGEEVRVSVNPWWHDTLRSVTAGQDGGYLADFSQANEGQDAYDIQHDDYVEVSVWDDNANRYYISAGSCRLIANINWDGIEGMFFPPNKDVIVLLNDGSKGTKELTTSGSGFFETGWWSEAWPQDYDINFGDTVTVKNADTQEVIREMTVASPLSATTVDVITDRVAGEKPIGGKTSLYVNPWDENGIGMQLDEQSGTYDISLGEYDFTYFDEGWIEHFDSNGNQTNISFATPKMSVDVTNKRINADFLTPNILVSIYYDGSLIPVPVMTRPSGSLEYEDTALNLEPGKKVEIKNQSGVVLVDHIIKNIAFNIDAEHDVVYGTGTPYSHITCFMNPNPWEGPQNWRELDATDAQGHFDFDYSKKSGWSDLYDIGQGFEGPEGHEDDNIFIQQGDGMGSRTVVSKKASDLIAPTMPVISPDRTYINNITTPSLTALSSDLSGISGYKWTIDGNPTANLGYFDLLGGNVDISAKTDGTYYLHIKARDPQGNFGAQLDKQIIIDRTNPTASMTQFSTAQYIRGIINIYANSNDANFDRIDLLHNSNPIYSSNSSSISYPWSSLAYNGPQTITTNAYDKAGNVSSTAQTINVDNYKPRTSAPKKAVVKRGRVAKLYWKVTDKYTGGYAYVTIKIKKGTRAVKSINLKLTKINSLRYYRFKAKISKGKYKFYIYAKDQAGNNQYKIASNYLIVK